MFSHRPADDLAGGVSERATAVEMRWGGLGSNPRSADYESSTPD
jgi:hypothetical protein